MPVGDRLSVEHFFSGTNYLEDLSKSKITELGIAKPYGGGFIQNVPDSIFNKFSTFTYSKFVSGARYEPGQHFIGYSVKDRYDQLTEANDADAQALQREESSRKEKANDLIGNGKGKAGSKTARKEYAASNAAVLEARERIEAARKNAAAWAIKNQSTLANPTASNIISWASTESTLTSVGFQPYAMTDFMFCKNYGKIPNNRLITLRRYPFPVDDRLAVDGKNQPIPIAQAVTWWGGDTQNALANIGVMKWNLKWTTLPVKYQEIRGNEVLISDLLKVFNGAGDKFKGLANQLGVLNAALTANDANLQQITGLEVKMQDYLKKLYEPNGPFWNRVYGPVNVIHESTRRERGMQDGWNTPFTLNFHYSFRSFNGLSPKIVALDLISSFLNLTYNDAPFLGQLSRYFAKPGLKFEPTVNEQIGNLLTQFATSFATSNSTQMFGLVQKLLNTIQAATNEGVRIAKEASKGNTQEAKDVGLKLLQAEAMTLLANAIPDFISMRSALSDRPIGEWHLVVGNPLNPIMVMGDLVCSGCTMKFDEEMGPDDFPTGVTFTVSLQQGKPRDKVAIERMFNLGESKMMRSKIRNPSSANDTFDTTNNNAWSSLQKGITPETIAEIEKSQNTEDKATFINYRNRIRKAYKYGDSQATARDTSKPFDDSLLWLYFDRGQDKT
jgi:hypothetical protein